MKKNNPVTNLEASVLSNIVGIGQRQITPRAIGKMHVTRDVIAKNPNAMAGAISTLQRKGFVTTGLTRSNNKYVAITRQGYEALVASI